MEIAINNILNQSKAIKQAIKDEFLNLPQNKDIKPLNFNIK